MNRNIRFSVFFSVLMLCFSMENKAFARNPSIRNAGRISQTIHQNASQALKPSFNIQSRYAGSMTGIAVSRNAALVATCSRNGAAQLWNTGTGQRIKDFRDGSDPVLSVDFVPGGKYLVSGSQKGLVTLWDLKSGAPVRQFTGNSGPVYKVKAAGNGRLLFSIGKSGAVLQWDIDGKSPIRSFSGCQGDVYALDISRKTPRIAGGGEDGKVRIWDWQKADPLQTFDGGGDITALSISDDDRYLAAGMGNGMIRIWNMNAGKQILSEKAHDGGVLGIAVSPDGRYLASSGKDKSIRLCSLPDGKELRRFTGHEDAVNDVGFTLDSRFLISASSDKTARFWNTDSGEELVRMVSMNSGWAVVSPEGYFDGSLDGDAEDRMDAIRWTVGERSLAVDGFMENYYRPALLGRLLAGQTIAEKELPRISDGFGLPPKTGITEPKNSSEVFDRTVLVTVESTEENGDIDEIRLFHNEKILDDSKSKQETRENGKRKVKMYPVELLDGQNSFRAVALNKLRIESEPAEISVTCRAANLPQPVLHLLVIGINEYRNPDLNLNFGVPDASAVRDHFAKAHTGIFNGLVKYELFDRNASKDAIYAKLEELSKVPIQDTVVIYFAGHGETLRDNWYFVPHDLTDPYENASLENGGISSSMIQLYIARIGARKIFLLMDACKSGAALGAFSEYEDQRPFALLARSSGIHIAAAAAKEQAAGELDELGHGVFTYSLLNALSGKADRNTDGKISVQETLNYIKEDMPVVIAKHEIPAQQPVVNSRGTDFPVAGQQN